MFGVANQGYVDMPEFVLAEFVGRMLYGIFTLVIVIVLLNMLVAMITNSFQKIESNTTVNDGGGENRVPYRLQVIKALVQRYIETARREFEETKRKDVGNRITELNKVVGRLHSEMKQIHETLLHSTAENKGTGVLGKYIMGAKNNFRGFDNKAEMGAYHASLQATVHHRGEVEEEGGRKREGEGDGQGYAGEGEGDEKTPMGEQTVSSPTNSKSSLDTGLGSPEEEESPEREAKSQNEKNTDINPLCGCVQVSACRTPAVCVERGCTLGSPVDSLPAEPGASKDPVRVILCHSEWMLATARPLMVNTPKSKGLRAPHYATTFHSPYWLVPEVCRKPYTWDNGPKSLRRLSIRKATAAMTTALET
ncbi:hypothetical protein JZ751_002228 [Albula glossodonta]|uniref:Ion transport domain-containing protein n=1 Tax=Albula glossodonta TaxID=121402 RepID=A0A8T2PFS4_9TELE|nr:hypothetical protein JZ751_002228 [Albula glossodonta]